MVDAISNILKLSQSVSISPLNPAVPAGWDSAARYPIQSVRFSQAMKVAGYLPFYVQEGARTALVQIQDPLGRGGSPLARAYIYPANESREFLACIIGELQSLGVAFIRIGNTMWGVSDPAHLALPGARVIERLTFHIDLSRSEEQLLRNMGGAARKIRKASKSGVNVGICASEEELEAFVSLYRETNLRIRQQGGSIATFPLSFYRKLLSHAGTSEGQFLLLLAKHNGRIIAGNLFLRHADTMIYYLGASRRDRTLTPLQAPAACFWHAIRLAKSWGVRTFDLGGCTPNLDPADSRHGVYEFKKRWGGEEVRFYNAEIVLSPTRYRLQESVRRILWDALNPVYFKVRSWMER